VFTIHDEKVLIAGDWHGVLFQGKQAIQKAVNEGITTIFHVGDFGVYPSYEKYLKGLNWTAKKSGITIYFVDGNHENFEYLYRYPLNEDGTRTLRSNIIHLPRGLVFKWGEHDVLALGGAYSVDKNMRTDRRDWFIEEWVTPEELALSIENSKGKDIKLMLMHDSPASCPNPVTDEIRSQLRGISLFGKENIDKSALHRRNLDAVFHAVKPTFLVHGHYHSRFTRRTEYGHVIGLHEGNYGTDANCIVFTQEYLSNPESIYQF